MASQNFEAKMQRAVEDREIPGAVLVAEDRDGEYRYEKAFGYRSLKNPSKPDPMPIDATMWLASCTKLVTSVAVMQCVERGQLKLDSDVSNILPELRDIQILKGFEEGSDGNGTPILVKNTKIITLRHLLTHSSGLTYDFFNPLMMRYRKRQGYTPNLNVKVNMRDAFTYPLLFAPGESWEYGVGLDWAGWMVERVNGNISLEEYLNKNIWAPLGVRSFSFYPKKSSAITSMMTDMSDREGCITMFGTTMNPNGKMVHTENTIWNMESKGCSGGAGGYGAPLDYQKMLHSILTDDEKLLKKETVDEMFKPQLTDVARGTLMDLLKIPDVNQIFGSLPTGTQVDCGIGGMLIMQDLAGRKKGTLTWGGHPNLKWFVDRVGGMAGIYGSQVTPPGDPKTNELFEAWEEEIYRTRGKEKL